MLCVVGQPEDEVLDRHGTQHAPTDVDGRLRGRNEDRQLTLVRDLFVMQYQYLLQTLHVYAI